MRQKASTSICHDIKTLSHAFLIIFITHVKICDPLTATARGSFHLCHFSVCICYVMLRNNRRRRDARIAPGRASKENKPFRAQFDAASEAWRKQESHQWASETSGRFRSIIIGRLRRPSVNAPVFSRPSRAANAPCGLFASPARPGAITVSLLRSFNQCLL